MLKGKEFGFLRFSVKNIFILTGLRRRGLVVRRSILVRIGRF